MSTVAFINPEIDLNIDIALHGNNAYCFMCLRITRDKHKGQKTLKIKAEAVVKFSEALSDVTTLNVVKTHQHSFSH